MKLFNFRNKKILIISIIILVILGCAIYFSLSNNKVPSETNLQIKKQFSSLDFSLGDQQKELLINWLKENSEIAVKKEIIICQDIFYIPSVLYKDIAEAIEEGLGIKITYYYVPWAKIIPALIEEKCDAIFELTISEERKGLILFTEPVYPGRDDAIAVSKGSDSLLEMFNSIITELKLIIR
jgi:hypothetical protein